MVTVTGGQAPLAVHLCQKTDPEKQHWLILSFWNVPEVAESPQAQAGLIYLEEGPEQLGLEGMQGAARECTRPGVSGRLLLISDPMGTRFPCPRRAEAETEAGCDAEALCAELKPGHAAMAPVQCCKASPPEKLCHGRQDKEPARTE